MSELKSPVQPFIVRHKGTLSALQMQSLIQLYQPIIGLDAVNFYLLLMQQPVNEQKISTQKVHSTLFPFVVGSLAKIDNARLQLEAVGLLHTYKQMTEGISYPTLFYDMQSPLLIKDFLESPLLSNTLIGLLGEGTFLDIIRQWEIAPIDMAEYEEVTVSFDTVFAPVKNNDQIQIDDVKKERKLVDDSSQKVALEAVETFDDNLLLRKLVQLGVNYQALGEKMRQEAIALHLTYQFDEEMVYQLFSRYLDKDKKSINYSALKIAAQKQSEQRSNVQKPSELKKVPKQVQVIANNIADLKQQFPQLNQEQLELIQLCEKVPPQSMLLQIKQNKNGFASSQEKHNVANLQKVSSLSRSIQTFLVYYLLAIRQRTDFQKGESERVANEWQQKGIDSVPKALLYVQQQLKGKEVKQKQKKNRTTTNKRVERQPYWATNQTTSSGNSSSTQTNQKIESEDVLRQRMKDLFKKGDETND